MNWGEGTSETRGLLKFVGEERIPAKGLQAHSVYNCGSSISFELWALTIEG